MPFLSNLVRRLILSSLLLAVCSASFAQAVDRVSESLLLKAGQLDADSLWRYLKTSDFVGDRERLVRSASTEYPMIRLEQRSNRNALDLLCGLGAKAISTLLFHLNDSRETTLVVGESGPVLRHRHYDPRKGGPSRDWFEDYYVDRSKFVPIGAYRVRIGDVAFFALGQIVNRWYQPIHSEGTLNVLNSPVLDPVLCRQVRRDWNIGSDELFRSLKRDVLEGDDGRARLAMRKVIAFYPAQAVEVALGRVNRIDKMSPAIFRGYHSEGAEVNKSTMTFLLSLGSLKSERLDKACLALARRVLERFATIPFATFVVLECAAILAPKPRFHGAAIELAMQLELHPEAAVELDTIRLVGF